MPTKRRLCMLDFATMTVFLSFSILTLSVAFPSKLLDNSAVPAFAKHNPRGLATNQSLHDDQARWEGRITCNEGRGMPLDDTDCLRAVQIMLVTDRNEPQQFGTKGSYQGPRSWISGSCKIALDLDHVRIWMTFLTAFARLAALVQDRCDKPGSLYYGGDLTYADLAGWEYITVTVTRIPGRSVARDLNNLTAGLLSPPFVQNHLSTPPLPWNARIKCDHGPGRPLFEVSCLRAVSYILLQLGSTVTYKFGTEGNYTGPHAWTEGQCTVSLDWTHARSLETNLLLIAKLAATIMDKCVPPGSWSYGGFAEIPYPKRVEWLQVNVTNSVDGGIASLD